MQGAAANAALAWFWGLNRMLLAINLPFPRVATAIITVKNRTLSPLAELFVDSARNIGAAITAPTRRKNA